MPQVPWLLTWLEVWGARLLAAIPRLEGVASARGSNAGAADGAASLVHLADDRPAVADARRRVRRRISVIPRGFAPPERLCNVAELPQTRVVAGRLLAYKRVDARSEAWPGRAAILPDAELDIVGDGPECRGSWNDSPRELSVGESVRFLGQVAASVNRFSTAIASAELLLQPSERRGQSTVVLEALSLGTPVLAAVGDETAVGDFLGPEPATAAVRVDVTAKPQAWAERIVQLLADESLRRRLADEGRHVAAELNWKADIAPRVECFIYD